MPELPEVEVMLRRLAPDLVQAHVQRFVPYAPRQLFPDARSFERIIGQRITAAKRRGKVVILATEDDGLVAIHLRMSGSLRIGAHGDASKHTRFELQMASGKSLLFDDPRRFGGVYVGPPMPSYIERIGPDPLDHPRAEEALLRTAASSRRRLKSLLLDQAVVSGVGNIYGDEALFRARLHPETPANRVDVASLRRLLGHLHDLMTTAIEHEGSSIDWVYRGGEMQDYLQVYGRRGKPCPICATLLTYKKVDKRGTTWCPRCQPSVGARQKRQV